MENIIDNAKPTTGAWLLVNNLRYLSVLEQLEASEKRETLIQRAVDEISTIRLDDSNVAKSAIFFIAKDLLQQGARFEEHGKVIIESILEQAFETINADY